MNKQSIGFIGGGRITRIFLEGWARANQTPANIIVSDPHAETLDSLKSRFPDILTTSDNARAAGQDLVFLAVHPPVMAEVAAGLCDPIQPNAVVVSLAPKFTIVKLTGLLGGFARLARVIPNAPSIIGAGFNPVAFAPELTSEEKNQVTGLLAPLGECPQVVEDKLEAYAVLTAMGPTYLWFQLQVLRELTAGFGLDDAEIAHALKAMVFGATQTLLESGLSPADVINLIPVKPLGAMEPQVTETYQTCLSAVYQKIKP